MEWLADPAGVVIAEDGGLLRWMDLNPFNRTSRMSPNTNISCAPAPIDLCMQFNAMKCTAIELPRPEVIGCLPEISIDSHHANMGRRLWTMIISPLYKQSPVGHSSPAGVKVVSAPVAP